MSKKKKEVSKNSSNYSYKIKGAIKGRIFGKIGSDKVSVRALKEDKPFADFLTLTAAKSYLGTSIQKIYKSIYEGEYIETKKGLLKFEQCEFVQIKEEKVKWY